MQGEAASADVEASASLFYSTFYAIKFDWGNFRKGTASENYIYSVGDLRLRWEHRLESCM